MAPLERYFSILKGKAEPKYLIAKRTPAGKPKSLDDAWKKHAGAISGKTTHGGFSLLGLKSYIAEKTLESCTFCGHSCKVDRRKSLGACKVGKDSFVSFAFAHLGEEPELVPSGTIFFSGCNFTCSFCQNWEISQSPENGYKWSPAMIAGWISGMKNGIANVNFVGGEPTPHLHNIINALLLSDARLPIVWNSNMYMSGDAMSLLDGIIDVYLSDFKYGNDGCAREISGIKDYFSTVSGNHLLAQKNGELLIRHLVLSGHSDCCSKPILCWIRENLGPTARVNIMGQYRPEHVASGKLGKAVSKKEVAEVGAYAREIGLSCLSPAGNARDYLGSE